MDCEDTYNSLRVASFSCYLNSEYDNFVLKLTGGIPHPSSSVISPQEETSPGINLGRSKKNGPENSVFGADKYFYMNKDQDKASKYEHEKDSTVSVSPEASSLNSLAAFLQSLRRNTRQTKQKRAIGLRFFPTFGCKGPCLDKKSVYIHESVDHEILQGTRQSQSGLDKGEQFSFPVLNSGIGDKSVTKQFEEDPRKSIEVFGSVVSKKGDRAVNLERKLSILTWDGIPKSSSSFCDDMASDASSDLFEIENISGVGCSILTTQESGDMSTIQNAPNEGSIEWSVVTASAVSDYEEKDIIIARDMISNSKRATTTRMVKPKDSGTGVTKDAQKLGASRLLGCRNHKAVRVTESAYRTNRKQKAESNIHLPFP